MPKRVKVRAPKCPVCPYAFVAPAHFRWYEWPLVLVLRRPYRCRECNTRYVGRFYPWELLRSRFRNQG